MRRPDLLVLVAVWQFLAAFLAFVSLIAIGVFAFPAVIYWVDRPTGIALFGLSVAVIILIVYIVLAVAAGIGLLNGKEWARIASIILAVLTLFNIPIGTVIGILILVYLTKEDVKDYFTPSKPAI
jgi:hypothetical protein